MIRLLCTLLLLACLSGCASDDKSARTSNKPLMSRADEKLEADIKKTIGLVEQTHGGVYDPVVVIDIKQLNDGTPARESWFIDRKGKTVRYDITMMPTQRTGKIELNVQGPYE